MEPTTQSANRIPRRKTAQARTRHTPHVRCEADTASFTDTHVKEAEPAKRIYLQQTARKELVLHLAKLHSAHLRTERRELTICLLSQLDQLCFTGVRTHSIDHPLFKNCEDTVQIFERHRVRFVHACRQFAKACRNRSEGFIQCPLACSRNLVCISFQIHRDALVLKTARMRADCALRSGTRCRLNHLFRRRHHGLRAPGEPVYLAQTAPRAHGSSLISVEGSINAAQHGLQWDAGLTPALNQRPVQRGEKQQRTAPAVEAVFNLREGVKVVLHRGTQQRARRLVAFLSLLSRPWSRSCSRYVAADDHDCVPR